MESLSLEVLENGIGIIRFDTPGHPVNIISSTLFSEFDTILRAIESDDRIVGVVLASGKQETFIAGADIREFISIRSAAEGEAFSRMGQHLLNRIEASSKPFVAAINGATLGGGLEIALACHYRLASDNTSTVIGVPEVSLGLLCGGGGTQRLPKIVGLKAALDLLLTGRRLRLRKAQSLGLVDAIVPSEALIDQAAEVALRLSRNEMVPRRRKRTLLDRLLESPPGWRYVLRKARESTLAKTRGHYPAPALTLQAVDAGYRSGPVSGYETESRNFGLLCAGPEAKELLGLFLAVNDNKKTAPHAPSSEVPVLGILGSGLMGAGIASVSLPIARVFVRDLSYDALSRAAKSIDTGLRSRVKSGSVTKFEADKLRSRLELTTDLNELARADLVVEAVFEDLKLKREVVATLEDIVGERAVIASNTSALPIHEIAANARHPDRIVGMHYFSPVHKMPLLEVVAPAKAADWAVERARAIGAAQGKTVIVVKDGPGFYTTRILATYLNEASLLLGDGARIEDVDSAMLGFGFPVGPLELIDQVGMDVAAHVSEFLGVAFASRGISSSAALEGLVKSDYLGRKNGKGFYDYAAARSGGLRPANQNIYSFFGGPERRQVSSAEIADRLSLIMVNEAVHCLQETIIASHVDGDLGAVLGLGFPPFRGGPFRYVDRLTSSEIVERLETLGRRLGPRFLPAPLLQDMARTNTRFYGGA